MYMTNRNNFRKEIVAKFNIYKQCNNENEINNIFIRVLQSATIELGDFMLMVNAGADPRFKNYLAFILSCGYSKADIATYLIDTYGFNEIIQDNLREIINYAKTGCCDILRLLLRNNIEPNSLIDISTPEKIQLLLDYDVDINLLLCQLVEISTPMNSIEYVISVLPQYYGNKIDNRLLNELLGTYISSSWDPKLHLIQILIECGADVNSTEDLPLTHIISKKMEEKLIINLLDYLINQYKYDINTNNSNALATAISYNKINVVTFLLDSGSKITDECIEKAINGGEECVNILLRYRVTLEKISEVYIHMMPNLWLAKKLIADGIDITNLIVNCNTK